MDHSTQFRRTYLGAAPHTLATSVIWLGAGALGDLMSVRASILFFLVAATFIFPVGELLRKMMKAGDYLDKANPLPRFFTLLAFTIPASYPLIWFACRGNVNLFFPSFAVLVGAHYLPFVQGYGMKSFLGMAVLLVAIGTTCGTAFPQSFSLAAYMTGTVLLVFAVINYTIVKNEKS
jgi:hypothetical protein